MLKRECVCLRERKFVYRYVCVRKKETVSESVSGRERERVFVCV